MCVVELFIQNYVVHELNRQFLEEAAEMDPELVSRQIGLKGPDESLGADWQTPPSAQFASRDFGGDPSARLTYELEHPKARSACQPQCGYKSAPPRLLKARKGFR